MQKHAREIAGCHDVVREGLGLMGLKAELLGEWSELFRRTCAFETSGPTVPTTQRHIQEDCILSSILSVAAVKYDKNTFIKAVFIRWISVSSRVQYT